MKDDAYDIISTRWSMIRCLKDKEDERSWKDFFDTYWRLIYWSAIKAGCSDTEAQEVVQETVICVVRQMEHFRADPTVGSFKGWLLSITRCRVADQLRLRARTRYGGLSEQTDADTAPDQPQEESLSAQFEEYWQAEWERNIMAAAIDRLREKVSPQQFKIFHLAVVKQLSVIEVAHALSVNAAQVYLAKHRVGRMLKREVRDLERSLF